MLLGHLDIASGLAQGHLVAADERPQDRRDSEPLEQRQRLIDALSILAGQSASPTPHVP
jgi:hypothetical protein